MTTTQRQMATEKMTALPRERARRIPYAVRATERVVFRGDRKLARSSTRFELKLGDSTIEVSRDEARALGAGLPHLAR